MKVTAFGEIMLRLSPDNHDRFMQENNFRAYFGGSEANTLIALSSLGINTSFVTKLPENDIADACIRELKGSGVETAFISRGGRRIGIYYCENGTSVRCGKVIYDRQFSSISEAGKTDFRWEEILQSTDIFHFTGITTALSDSLVEITLEAVKKAKEKGITVSCDLNYRRTLWSEEKANGIMKKFMPYVDILFANTGSALDVFGIGGKDDKEVMAKLSEEFGIKTIAFTTRECRSADENTLGGILLADGKFYASKKTEVNIVDRVGGGDCFDAGILYGIISGFSPEETVEFANICNVYKHTVRGDFCRLNAEEIKAVCSGESDGRIKR